MKITNEQLADSALQLDLDELGSLIKKLEDVKFYKQLNEYPAFEISIQFSGSLNAAKNLAATISAEEGVDGTRVLRQTGKNVWEQVK